MEMSVRDERIFQEMLVLHSMKKDAGFGNMKTV